MAIVDDDDHRQLTAMVSETGGAKVLTAADLIFCDLSLGDRLGEDLLAEFRERGFGCRSQTKLLPMCCTNRPGM